VQAVGYVYPDSTAKADARAVTFTVHPQHFAYVDTGVQGGVSTGAPVQPAATAVPQSAQTATPQPHPTSAPIATATPAPAAQQLQVSVRVTPSQMAYGAYPTVTIRTAPNASCHINVLYHETGRQPTSYPEHDSVAGAGGTITEQGQWHQETKGVTGTVTANCTLGGRNGNGTADFTVAS
jgi:hypothetical protein